MKPLPHRYFVRLAGRTGERATLSVPGMPLLRVAPPVEFGGPGDEWSAEHLLLAAVETCYLFTLRAIARGSSVELGDVDIRADGMVDAEDGHPRFVEITLRPTVRLAGAGDRDRVGRVLDKTARACLITASLGVPVRVEPEIVGP